MTDMLNNTIIDSCGWIEFFSDGPLASKFEKIIMKAGPDNFFTPTIVIYEVFKKIRSKYSEEEALKAIAHIKY
ncbi:MAG: PIN domain-containing protein, partial [Candidatus Thermoplasmatota archaeon]|nr:PIN domain-containing protein [Candidatus Thermoplasmatota archaeon]